MTTRNWIALTVYLAMIGVGGWATWEWLVNGSRRIAFKLGAFPALFGMYLLWTDFLIPSREPL